jgi:hypothetical protein
VAYEPQIWGYFLALLRLSGSPQKPESGFSTGICLVMSSYSEFKRSSPLR